MKKRKQLSSGGRYTYICPNCHNRDRSKMTTGQRAALADCELCGFIWDADTGLGYMKDLTKVAVDLDKLGQ